MVEEIYNSPDSQQSVNPLEIERAKYDNERPTRSFQQSGLEITAHYNPQKPNQIEIHPNIGTNLQERENSRKQISLATQFPNSKIRVPENLDSSTLQPQNNLSQGYQTLEFISGLSFDQFEEKHTPERSKDWKDFEKRKNLLTPEIRLKAVKDLLSVIDNLNAKGLAMPDFKSSMIKFFEGETIIIDTYVTDMRHIPQTWDSTAIEQLFNILGDTDILDSERKEKLKTKLLSKFPNSNDQINNPKATNIIRSFLKDLPTQKPINLHTEQQSKDPAIEVRHIVKELDQKLSTKPNEKAVGIDLVTKGHFRRITYHKDINNNITGITVASKNKDEKTERIVFDLTQQPNKHDLRKLRLLKKRILSLLEPVTERRLASWESDGFPLEKDIQDKRGNNITFKIGKTYHTQRAI